MLVPPTRRTAAVAMGTTTTCGTKLAGARRPRPMPDAWRSPIEMAPGTSAYGSCWSWARSRLSVRHAVGVPGDWGLGTPARTLPHRPSVRRTLGMVLGALIVVVVLVWVVGVVYSNP